LAYACRAVDQCRAREGGRVASHGRESVGRPRGAFDRRPRSARCAEAGIDAEDDGGVEDGKSEHRSRLRQRRRGTMAALSLLVVAVFAALLTTAGIRLFSQNAIS
jgi:hypothetical protein